MITMKLKEKADIVNAIVDDFGTDPDPVAVLNALEDHVQDLTESLEKGKAKIQASKELIREYKKEVKKSQVKAVKLQAPKQSEQSVLFH